jgi:hypothetical protein
MIFPWIRGIQLATGYIAQIATLSGVPIVMIPSDD